MRALLLVVVLATGAIAPAWGQYAVLELGVGSNEGRAGRHHGRFNELGAQGYIEGRLWFDDSWAGSIQLMGGQAKNRIDGYKTSQILLSFYCDYGYRVRGITFFVSAGLGMGYVDDDTLPIYESYEVDDYGNEYRETSGFNQFLFSPRVGIELWDRLRLSAEWRLMTHSEYSTMGITAGFMFGRP
jgi:hypothetical protein